MANKPEHYLDSPAGQALLEIARQSLEAYIQEGRLLQPELEACLPAIRHPGASFVTLTKQGELRGCIGTVEAGRPLAWDVAQNSVAAASRDPRFPPLKEEELAAVNLSVTVLTPPEQLVYQDYAELLQLLVPGEDGVILIFREKRGILLPQVWDRIPDPAVFLDSICRKAYIPAGLLRQSPPQVVVKTFRAQHFYEPGYLEPGGRPPQAN